MPRVDLSTLNPESVERLRVLAVSVIALESHLIGLGATRESIKEAIIEAIPNILNMTKKEKEHFKED